MVTPPATGDPDGSIRRAPLLTPSRLRASPPLAAVRPSVQARDQILLPVYVRSQQQPWSEGKAVVLQYAFDGREEHLALVVSNPLENVSYELVELGDDCQVYTGQRWQPLVDLGGSSVFVNYAHAQDIRLEALPTEDPNAKVKDDKKKTPKKTPKKSAGESKPAAAESRKQAPATPTRKRAASEMEEDEEDEEEDVPTTRSGKTPKKETPKAKTPKKKTPKKDAPRTPKGGKTPKTDAKTDAKKDAKKDAPTPGKSGKLLPADLVAACDKPSPLERLLAGLVGVKSVARARAILVSLAEPGVVGDDVRSIAEAMLPAPDNAIEKMLQEK